MSWRSKYVCSLFAIGLQVVPVSAGTCDLPGKIISPLTNGNLLALTNGIWAEFQGFQNLRGPALISFAYVVRPWFSERAGVVVIKTARVRPSLSDRHLGSITLVRNEKSGDPQCTSGAFGQRQVSVQAYEDYHGRGYWESKALDAVVEGKETNASIIKVFHSKYKTAKSCRSSDELNDPNNVFEYRNNRSQFSYDTKVVDNGWSTATTTLLMSVIPTALAAPPRLRDQRTEIRHYKTGAAEPQCIRFQVSASGPDQVLRVNDLEN